MKRRTVLVAPLEHLLHPINVRSGAVDALDWTQLFEGPMFHTLGHAERAVAGVLRTNGAAVKIPREVCGVNWHRGWTIVIPVYGGIELDGQRVEAQHFGVLPPFADGDEVRMDDGGLALFFHPGPHADQRGRRVLGSLDALLHPISVNRRHLARAERDSWEAGVTAYSLPGIDDDRVDISVLHIPSSARTERHRHGTRGELVLMLDKSGRISLGDESISSGFFDLEGPGTVHELRVLEECWALQASLDGTELEEV